MTQPSLDLREAEATLHSVIEVLIDSQEAFQQIGDAAYVGQASGGVGAGGPEQYVIRLVALQDLVDQV